MSSQLELKEQKRVERAVAYVVKRLNSPILFMVASMADYARSPDDDEGGILAIGRSYRGQADKNSFILFFDAEQTKALTSAELRRTVWHEWLHAVTWDYTDEVENIMKYVKDGSLKDELIDRLYNARENVTYNLERTLGPHVFPSFDWEEK